MWAVGCIFGEMLLNEPLFPGRTEVEMLERMVRLLGSPNEAIWPVRSMAPSTLLHSTSLPEQATSTPRKWVLPTSLPAAHMCNQGGVLLTIT